jgi:IS605 OrfB family transposase
MRFTSFSFTLCPSPAEEQVLLRHAGAARFAYNQGLALLNDAYAAHKRDPAIRVPYSGFDLIKAFNAWKRSPKAGVVEDGTAGLRWRHEVLAQVFEEAKTHAHVALEDLHVAGMLRNRHLSRSIADAAWSEFSAQVVYKAAWYNCRVVFVDRFFPSSKRCHRCGHTVDALPLSQRWFTCPTCGLSCDRDTNAAANCAQHADQQNVAAKRVETQNARGGEGAGCSREAAVKPAPKKRERRAASAARPTPGKGGVGLNVNAL